MSYLATEQECPELGSRLERWIAHRTGGRVHRLRVEKVGDRVIVRGHTGSYHVRQLALAAVLELLEPQQVESVEMQIDVGNGSPKATSDLASRATSSRWQADAVDRRFWLHD